MRGMQHLDEDLLSQDWCMCAFLGRCGHLKNEAGKFQQCKQELHEAKARHVLWEMAKNFCNHMIGRSLLLVWAWSQDLFHLNLFWQELMLLLNCSRRRLPSAPGKAGGG